jgi:NADP-dependent 3-hydroxy acid dehydrogenase YdfG
MQKQRSGHIIINIASTAGLRVRPTMAVYSVTKFAVPAISEGLRQEATTYNIRSTVISPGQPKPTCPTALLIPMSLRPFVSSIRSLFLPCRWRRP